MVITRAAMRIETLAPRPDPFERPAPPSKTDQRDPASGKQGLLAPTPGIPAPTLWARLKNLTKQVGFSPIAKAQAASPFVWTCFCWSWQWKYRGGFCRDYGAWTNAYASGPGAGGGCGGALPHTKHPVCARLCPCRERYRRRVLLQLRPGAPSPTTTSAASGRRTEPAAAITSFT